MPDGALTPIDRIARSTPENTSGTGLNLQAISAPDGAIVWVSGTLPSAVHDLKPARIWGVLRVLQATELLVLADKGYHGAQDRC